MKQIAMLLACLAGTVLLARAELRTIHVTDAAAQGVLDPASPAWREAPEVSLGLQRTPLLYPTDAPAALEIPSVQIQVLRASGHFYVRLEWKDPTRNASELAPAKRVWQGEHLVSQSGATDRFSDACAVMVPAAEDASGVNPSLQMGDATHPVQIFLWDATRGAAVMEARGRETTHRTGKAFSAQSSWSEGKWAVTLELPELPAGTPLAVAVWNGSQQDRDGRKYFSVWYRTQ
jgi:hypothetical protein